MSRLFPLLSIGALLGCGNPAQTASGLSPLPSISVVKLLTDSTHHRVIVKITNDSGIKGYTMIGIRCTFLMGEHVKDETGSVATNVAFHQVVHESLIGPTKDIAVDNAQCRVSYANE